MANRRPSFTGDLLFVNDVGRPDLRDADEDPSALAGKLYDSLFDKILALPDDVKVYPAHGAGSLCGRAISDAPFSLVGQERRLNWALQIEDRAEFVRQMTANLPDRPAYFPFDVDLNLKGAEPISSLPPLKAITEERTDGGRGEGRRRYRYPIRRRFRRADIFPAASTLASAVRHSAPGRVSVVPGEKSIALVVGSANDAAKARLELARIGFDNVAGYITADALTRKEALPQISATDLQAKAEKRRRAAAGRCSDADGMEEPARRWRASFIARLAGRARE